MKPHPRSPTAYHESGHATVCLSLGVDVWGATIIPSENLLGQIMHDAIEIKTENDFKKEAAIALAGSIGEAIYRGRNPETGGECDRENLAKRCPAGWGFERIKRLLNQGAALATRTILAHRLAFDTIAKSLLEHGTLDGDDVQTIWKACHPVKHRIVVKPVAPRRIVIKVPWVAVAEW